MIKFAKLLLISNHIKDKNTKPFSFSNNKNIVLILDSELITSSEEVHQLKNIFSKSNFSYWILLENKSNNLTNTFYFHKKIFSIFGNIKTPVLKEVLNEHYDIIIDFSTQKGKIFDKIYKLCYADIKISFSKNVDANLYIVQKKFNFKEYVQEIIKYIQLYK